MAYRCTIPKGGIAWPFRVHGGYIEQYNQRSGEWVAPKGNKDNNGYSVLTWKSPEGRRFSKAHVVVWVTHNGPIPDGLEIDHIDGDKSNNHIGNLRLCTHAENIRSARERLGNWSAKNAKLKPHQMDLILALQGPCIWALKPLAERWGVSKFYLANARSQAKKKGDPRYCAEL